MHIDVIENVHAKWRIDCNHPICITHHECKEIIILQGVLFAMFICSSFILRKPEGSCYRSELVAVKKKK